MVPREWSAGTAEPGDGPPDPAEWVDVEVPGRPAGFAGADAVAYRVRFPDPRSGTDDRASVVLSGLYAHARVWLNGDFLGRNDAYFTPFRAPFDPDDENTLVVECRRPDDRFGGVHDTDLIAAEERVPGIWWDARVETHPDPFLSDLRVRPRTTSGGGRLDVTVTVDAADGVDDRVTLSARPEDAGGGAMMERAAVAGDPGSLVTVERSIDVREPVRWWPRGFGEPNRYTVRASLGESERRVSTGFCSVEHRDEGLAVNGQRVPVRGVGLLDATPADVERATEANANLVRARAHVPPPEVFEACTREGVLVWQDLPLTGPGGFDVDRGRELVKALVGRYRRHPSLAFFGVHDDPVPSLGEGVGTGLLARLRLRWRAWRTSYDGEPAAAVAASFPDDRPVFPVVGPPGTEPDATILFPGWTYGTARDVEWLCTRFPGTCRVVGAFGAGAIVDDAASAEDLGGVAPAAIEANAGGSVERSQAYQARVLATVAETLRREGSHALTAFALRDTGSCRMGVLGPDGDEKEGYRALSESFAPIQAVLDDPEPGPGEVGITVINDTPGLEMGVLEWTAGAEGGRLEVGVEPLARSRVGTIDVPARADGVELTLSIAGGSVRNTYRL